MKKERLQLWDYEQDTIFIRHPIKIKANICIRIRKWLRIKIMNLLY